MWKLNTKFIKKFPLSTYTPACNVVYAISARTCSRKAGLMHIPLDDVYVGWRQLPRSVTSACSLSLGDELIFGGKSRVAEIGGKKRERGRGSRKRGDRGAPPKEGGVWSRNVFASPKK